MTPPAVDWDSPTWGRPGHNVHVASNGSDVPDRHDSTSGGEH
jgi:hypothetical protein